MMRNNQCNDYVSFLNELGLTRELDLEQVADRLRHLIVNEWQGPNMHEYKQFLVGEDPDVFIEAERFRNSGTFATSLGDCMPLAMSNVLRIPILIISTQASTPVLNVSGRDIYSHAEPLYLSYNLAGPGHYDALVQDTGTKFDQNNSRWSS